MQRIVIAGSGILGLTAAIRLHGEGVRDITLIDPRIHEHTRSAVIDSNVLIAIQRIIQHKLKRPPQAEKSQPYRIKDIQRMLQPIAEGLGIKMIQGDFKRQLDGGLVEYVDSKAELKSVPHDLLIEATGSKCAVIKSINERERKAPVFKFAEIDTHPFKNFYMAYVSMPNADDRQQLINGSARQFPKNYERNLDYIRLFHVLRKNFGWKKFKAPMLKVGAIKKDKVQIFVETPTALPPSERIAFLNAVIHLHAERGDIEFKPLKPSEKYLRAASYENAFVAQPRIVTPSFYKAENHPLVILIGDARFVGDFRYGNSTVEALKILSAMCMSFTFEKEKIILFDAIYYAKKIEVLDKIFSQFISEKYEQARVAMKTQLLDHQFRYEKALVETKNTDEKTAFRQVLSELSLDLTLTQYQTYLRDNFSPVLSREAKGIPKIPNEKELFAIIASLKQLSKDFAENYLIVDINKGLFDYAIYFQRLAELLFTNGNFKDSERFYETVVEIFQDLISKSSASVQHLPNINGLIKPLFEKLIVVAKINRAYYRSVAIAFEGLDYLAKNADPENPKFECRFNYLLAEGLVKQIQQELEMSNTKIEIMQENFETADTVLLNLSSNPYQNADQLFKLQGELWACFEKMRSFVGKTATAPAMKAAL